MKIISTFNDKIYEFSGKDMIKTVRQYMPEVEIQVYVEFKKEKNRKELEKMGVRVINADSVPQRKEVWEGNLDIITKPYGGKAPKEDEKCNSGWNRRWFGWFQKVIAQHHAIVEEDYDDYIIFLDSDCRLLKGLSRKFLRETTQGKAVSFFKGMRPAIESGVIIVDCASQFSKQFYSHFMSLFTTKQFRKFNRWDDGYVLTRAIYGEGGFGNGVPASMNHTQNLCDIAEGLRAPKSWTNSNGYETGGQIISQTDWNKYIEHAKGTHGRNSVVK